MANDDRPQHDPADEHTDGTAATDRIPESPPDPPVAAQERKARFAAVREPARRHPVGAAVGAAAAGLVIGFVGGTLFDAHPMLSLSVGTAPIEHPAPPGPGFWGPDGPGGPGGRGGHERGPGPADRGPGGPADRGPGGPGGPGRHGPPPPPPGGPRGPEAPGSPAAPDAPPPPAPGGPAGQVPAPGTAPLPAERGATPQT